VNALLERSLQLHQIYQDCLEIGTNYNVKVQADLQPQWCGGDSIRYVGLSNKQVQEAIIQYKWFFIMIIDLLCSGYVLWRDVGWLKMNFLSMGDCLGLSTWWERDLDWVLGCFVSRHVKHFNGI
jgi:hypothetical protein